MIRYDDMDEHIKQAREHLEELVSILDGTAYDESLEKAAKALMLVVELDEGWYS